YGPNGFYREFHVAQNDPGLIVECSYQNDAIRPSNLSGNLVLSVTNNSSKMAHISIDDKSYKKGTKVLTVKSKGKSSLIFDLSKSFNWYDLEVTAAEHSDFNQRFAGRVETGLVTKTDPLMGQMV
ncbi:MAG: DUF756 domain-containing protein, partial [Pedobacter sp.]